MMHTSCGSLALKDFYAAEDSFLVKKLRDAGAIILGKTNMTEWANFMSDRMTNGWSSRGGQVNNPYGLFDVGVRVREPVRVSPRIWQLWQSVRRRQGQSSTRQRRTRSLALSRL